MELHTMEGLFMSKEQQMDNDAKKIANILYRTEQELRAEGLSDEEIRKHIEDILKGAIDLKADKEDTNK